MSALGLMSDAQSAAFERLCKAVSGRSGPGLTLLEIRDVSGLARELGKSDSDPERIEVFCDRLDLDPADLR